jgi:hypothetical protein
MLLHFSRLLLTNFAPTKVQFLFATASHRIARWFYFPTKIPKFGEFWRA